jgi:predicted Zn-dependent protease
MKNISLIIATSVLSIGLYAQEYEEKIANLSCEYIQNIDIKKNVETEMKKCILQAKFQVEQKHPELKPNVSHEELREKYKTVYNIISANCKSLTTKRSDYKKQFKYINSKNKEANFNYVKARQFISEKKYNEAINALKLSVKLDPEFIMAFDQLGIAYTLNKELKRSIKPFKSSLKLFPEGEIALSNLAESQLMLEDNKDAAITFGILNSYYPENPYAYWGLAKIEFANEIYETALYNAINSLHYLPSNDAEAVNKTIKLIQLIQESMPSQDELKVFQKTCNDNGFDYKKLN